MATAVVWLAMMVIPEACPWKRWVAEESYASARKERLEPVGMLPMIPPQEPLDLARSTVMVDMSEAEIVTLTRVMSLADRACVEATNWTEPVGWGEVQAARESSSTAA